MKIKNQKLWILFQDLLMISGYCFAILVVPSPIFGITAVVVGYLIVAVIGKRYNFGPGVNYTYFGIASVCILTTSSLFYSPCSFLGHSNMS